MNLTIPPSITIGLIVGVILLAMGVAAFVAPDRLKQSRVGGVLVSGRILFAVIGAVLTVSAFFTGATPESQLANPMPRTVQSIEIGRSIYLSNCAACHGIDARGGGPQSGSTPVRPPALVGPGSHLADHTDGDLHYWIANGLPGGMPAWVGQLTDEDIWHVVNYLRSLNGELPAATP